MVSRRARLTPKLFTDRIEKVYVHDGYRKGLVIAGMRDEHVVALSTDGIVALRSDAFAEKFPERFFATGIADTNMITVAVGLGISGKIPFVASEAALSPGRTFEHIRTTACYNDANIKIAGHRAGISGGQEGAVHQAYEDISTVRTLPHMKIFVPCDAIEAEKATIAASQIWGPVYLRFSAQKNPLITTEETPFLPGKAEVYWESYGKKRTPQVALIACGPLVYDALIAADELEQEGIGSIVLNNHTIKPMDEKKIIEVAQVCGAVVTIEDHQIMGGMGSAVAEILTKNYPVPQEFIGMHDVFGESGRLQELKEKYFMDITAIKKAVKTVLKRKKK
ncbi:MAG: transketolase C-terminal domain-containing protein [bacterium]